MPLLNITFWVLVGFIAGWSLHALQDAENGPVAQQAPTESPPPAAIAENGENTPAKDADPFRAHLMRGEVREALLIYRETRRKTPARADDMRQVLLNRARQLMARKKTDEAGQLLAQYLESDSYDPDALLLRARLDASRGQYARALENALDAKIYDRDNTLAETADQLIDQTTETWRRRLTAKKQWGKLGELYHLLIEKNGDRPEYYYALAGAQYRSGRYGEGLGTLNRILHDPEWGGKARKLSQLVEQLAQLGEGAPIAMTRKSNHFLVKVRVNDRTADLVLDTGASISILRREFARAIGLSTEGGEQARFNAVGSQVDVTIVPTRSFSVGDITFNDMPVGIAEMPETFAADGLLGMDFLGNFRFSIDQDNEVLNLRAP